MEIRSLQWGFAMRVRRSEERNMQSTQQSGKKYKSILNIVDEKSYGLLDSPLHWMAYLLNPYYFYKDMSIQFDQDVITATFKCVDAFYPNDLDARTFFINTELAMYAKKERNFGHPTASH